MSESDCDREKSPISLQELCCRLVVDSAQWRSLPELILPVDTYQYVEDYVSEKKERSRILAYIYTQFYKNSGIRKFNLCRLESDIFLSVLDLENVLDLDLMESSLPEASYISIVKRAINLEYLNLSYCVSGFGCDKDYGLIGDDCLIAIAQNCCKIVQLSMHYSKVTLEGVRTAFKKSSFLNLRWLHCENIGGNVDGLCEQIILEHTPALELMKSRNIMIGLKNVWLDKNKFAAVCHDPFQLSAIFLDYNIPDVDIAFYKDLKLFCPNLSKLRLNLSDFKSDCNFFTKGDLPSITKLYLNCDLGKDSEDPKLFEKIALNILGACGSTVLKLKLWFEGHVRIRCVDILQHCPKLQKLIVDNYFGVDFSHGITERRAILPSLSYFHFEKNDECSGKEFDDDLVAVCRLFPNLKALYIRHAAFRHSKPWCDLFLTEGMFSHLKDCSFVGMVSPADYILLILRNIHLFPKLRSLRYVENKHGRKAVGLSKKKCHKWDWILDQASGYSIWKNLNHIYSYE